MTTIFPAPGTITSNNSYIVNWYIYDKQALQHPLLVKQRTDVFAEVTDNTDINNLELYQSNIYGSITTTVVNQTQQYSTVNTNIAEWYAFEKNVVTYTTNQATTITLYFVNQLQHVILFKAGSNVRVSSPQSGYTKIFTVLSSNSYSITINFDVIPPHRLIIDNIFETVYYQNRFSIESNLGSIHRENLNRSFMAPSQFPSIQIPISENIKSADSVNRLTVGKQTAMAVYKGITTNHTVDRVTKLKTDIREVIPPAVPVTLSTYISDISGQYSFDISSQTPQYVTVDTSTVSWYIYDTDKISYTTRLNSTLTLYFNNPVYYQFVPFPTGSTVRIRNKFSQYSNTFVVLKGAGYYVTIEYTEIESDGAIIDNMYETVFYQSRTLAELSTASNPRKNLVFSLTPAISPSIKLPIVEKFASADNSSQLLTVIGKQSSVSIFKGVTTNHTIDKITNLRTDIRSVTPTVQSTRLETYESSSYGEFKFNIISQTPKFVTVNTSVVDWYINGSDILSYTTSMLLTTTVYFNNPAYNHVIPFKTGTTIRISNHVYGFTNTFTVINGTSNSVTIDYADFDSDNAIIDNIIESVFYQSRIVSEYPSASVSRKNMLASIVAPVAAPSIQIPTKEYIKTVVSKLTSDNLEKPISVMKEVYSPVKADPVNKVKFATAEIKTTVISDNLEKHIAPVTGEYIFPVISRNVDYETYNTSIVDSYLFDNDIITTSVRQLSYITMYFSTPYYQQFIPFPTNSTVRISNKRWFSETFTVLNGTTDSITILMKLDMPFDLYIDNIVETVYNQDHTYTTISTASDSRKKLFYSVMLPSMFNFPIGTVSSSVSDSIVESGNLAKQLLVLSTVNTDLSSAAISKQLFNLTTDTSNISSAIVDTFKVISDLIDTSVDQSRSLTHYDLLVDGVSVYVSGQPINYNVPDWYIKDLDNRFIGVLNTPSETTTLMFYHDNIWKLFLENQYVRIKQPASNFSQDILVTSATLFSITFDTVAGFPTNYTGMTINHLYSPIYAQSLVDVPINPETLLLPRENLAAASNIPFTSMFPIGKLVYNSRGTTSFVTITTDMTSVGLPTTSSILNSFDTVQSGLSLYVSGQPINYNVPNWYIKDLDNRLTGIADPIEPTTTLMFTNTDVLCPFLENQYVRITQPSAGFTQDVLVVSNTQSSITFNSVLGFPTNYTGMTINQLYSSVYHQALVDNEITPLINPTNLTLPRENLAASKNTGFISLFPISKLIYNNRGTYAISPNVPTVSSSSVAVPYSLTPYDTTPDGVTVYVIGQPLIYNVVEWYLKDVDNRLIASPVTNSTTTLTFSNTTPIPLFTAGYNVRIKQGDVNFVQDVLVTSANMYSITFDSIVGFPTNYTGMTISRLYSPISEQSVVNAQYANLIRPTDLTTAQQNLAASLLKPNFRGSQIIFGGIERFSNFAIDNDISGKLELFNDTKIPGDFDLAITSSTLTSYTTNTQTSDWYNFDELILSYDTITTDYITLRFNDLSFVPFPTNTTVKIISNNQTFFTTVVNGTSSSVVVEHYGNIILENTRIQRIVSSVYPQDFVSTTVAPVLPRENLYYMRLRSSTSLNAYFQQPSAVTTVSVLDKQITSLKGDSRLNNQQGTVNKLQVNNINVITDKNSASALSNITVLKPVTVDLSMLSLKYLPTVVGEKNVQRTGIVDKFLVNRISEIGRETVLTVTSTKISPIQFWN
jgi:hypothetical protein